MNDDQQFASPGSALRRATKRNPRNLPCPTCKEPNRLTPADVRRGYQCDQCADREEGLSFARARARKVPHPPLPMTGDACGCRRGVERDNCPNCEGTGLAINWRAVHHPNQLDAGEGGTNDRLFDEGEE